MSSGLKIAVVEDHEDLRNLFVGFLNGQSHDVAGFSCADELDEHLADNAVDLMILDLNLPGEDGFSIAQRFRAVHPDLHIIMLTARTAAATDMPLRLRHVPAPQLRGHSLLEPPVHTRGQVLTRRHR